MSGETPEKRTMLGLIGKKVGMTQRFTDAGNAVPVTVVETGPCTVVQVRTRDRDGYDALQLGFGTRREVTKTKADIGHAKKAGRQPFDSLVEFSLDAPGEYEIGQQLSVAELFSAGDKIDVTGTSKGRGFAGVMKRHNFKGHKATHGTHESFRGPGAIGACAYPGKVWKGQKMPGRMGGERTTVQNLKVLEVVADDNLLLVTGAVPGARNCQLILRPAVKRSMRG